MSDHINYHDEMSLLMNSLVVTADAARWLHTSSAGHRPFSTISSKRIRVKGLKGFPATSLSDKSALRFPLMESHENQISFNGSGGSVQNHQSH